jgi:hypothetical protein
MPNGEVTSSEVYRGLQEVRGDIRAFRREFVIIEVYRGDQQRANDRLKAMEDDIDVIATSLKERDEHRRANRRLLVGQWVLPMLATFIAGIAVTAVSLVLTGVLK